VDDVRSRPHLETSYEKLFGTGAGGQVAAWRQVVGFLRGAVAAEMVTEADVTRATTLSEAGSYQALTLVRSSAQRKHFLQDTLGSSSDKNGSGWAEKWTSGSPGRYTAFIFTDLS